MTEIKFVTVGKAGTVHGSTDGEKTLCSKPVATIVNNPAATIACVACIKAAKILTEETENVTETTETAEPTDQQAIPEPAGPKFSELSEADQQAVADVNRIIEELAKLTKADAEKIDALAAQGETEKDKITAVGRKADSSMRLKHAVNQAKTRPSTALVIRKPTTDVTKIEGYAEIVEDAATKVAAGVRAEVGAQETAKIIAEAILEGRLRCYNKQGHPDVRAERDETKKLSGNIYRAAAEKLVAENYSSDIVDVDELLKSLQDKVQYQMTAVAPALFYSMDTDRERFAELWPALDQLLTEKQTEDPEDETKPSDMLFDLYKINRKSKAELAKERRAKKALEAEKAKATPELESGSEGADSGEGEEEEAPEEPTKTPTEKLAANMAKEAKAVSKANYDTMTDAEAEALSAAISAMSEAILSASAKLAARNLRK
ncbi:hypothetical protein [Kitasatospora sp. NPDC001132]